MQCKIGKAVGEKAAKTSRFDALGFFCLGGLWPNIAKLKPKPNEGVTCEAGAKEGSCCRSGPLVDELKPFMAPIQYDSLNGFEESPVSLPEWRSVLQLL